MITSIDIHKLYTQKFGKVTVQVSSPGRANIIGEHTDYNDGYVLPFAINKRIYFAAGPNRDNCFKIYSANLNKEVTIYPNQHWDKGFARFFSSVIITLSKYGHQLSGLNIVFGGDLPIGGGMSSSSSIACGFIALLDSQFSLGLSKEDIVNLAVEAEHGVGVEGGKMDQYSIVYGQKEKAILLDCLKSTATFIDLDLGSYIFCLFDTNVSHNLEATEYNTRSRTCMKALSKLKSEFGEVSSFRDVTPSHLTVLSDLEKQRVSHVIAENQRVLDTVKAFDKGDLVRVGMFLDQSHHSLRDQYEVSCPELDFLQKLLSQHEQVLGARMMGGGFGGSVITLLKTESLKEISLNLERSYKDKFDKVLDVYLIKPEEGLRVTTLLP